MNTHKLSSLPTEEKIRLGKHYSQLMIDNSRELWYKIKANDLTDIQKVTHKGFRIIKRMRKLFYAMSTSEQEVLIKTEMDLINEYNVDAHFKRVSSNLTLEVHCNGTVKSGKKSDFLTCDFPFREVHKITDGLNCIHVWLG